MEIYIRTLLATAIKGDDKTMIFDKIFNRKSYEFKKYMKKAKKIINKNKKECK